MIRLTKAYGRYGYRKITQLLHIEGWKVNHKRVERLWREEGQDVQMLAGHSSLAVTQRYIECDGDARLKFVVCI